MSGSNGNRRASLALGACFGALCTATGCLNETPTTLGGDPFPGEPVTVEIQVAWDDFASNLEVFGGYGAARQLGVGVVASDYASSLNARTLVRFFGYPASISVVDTTGTTRTDTAYVITGGRVVARFSRSASTNGSTPVDLAIGVVQEGWDPASVTWTDAVDTIGVRTAWTEAGAGPVVPLVTATWTPALGDSAFFELDSAQVAIWRDTTAVRLGARIDLETASQRLEIYDLTLRLDARSELNPDTLVVLEVPRTDLTFVYDPVPQPPPDGIRVGGVPAWRSVLDVDMPTVLNGPPELCAVLGCPLQLRPEQLSYAALVLRSRATEAAFQPLDSVGLDARPVLDRGTLPKAPMGGSLIGAAGRNFSAAYFGTEEGTAVEIPITLFARDLLAEVDPSQIPPPHTIALLSTFEPLSISFASFFGPGVPEAPILKLIVTVGRAVELP